MKQISTLTIALVLLAVSAQAQIPNGDFENWTAGTGYSTPDNWGNLNGATASASTYTCMKGTPGAVGSSYLQLISKTVTGMGVMPGIAATGTINMGTMSVKGGFANHCTSG